MMSFEAEWAQKTEAEKVEEFCRMIDQFDRGLRGLAYRLLGDRDQMDDALQETYLKAFRSLGSFSGQSPFGAWLYRIAYNVCMDQLRRRSRAVHLPLNEEAGHAGIDRDPSDIAAERHDLARALTSLPVEQRAVVLLVDAEGMDYREASLILGIPPGTVGSRLSRARSALRTVLASRIEGRDQW